MGQLIKADFKNRTWERPDVTPAEEQQSQVDSLDAVSDIHELAHAAHEAGFYTEKAMLLVPGPDGQMVVQGMNGTGGAEKELEMLKFAVTKLAGQAVATDES